MFFFYSGHLQNERERPDMKQKCMDTNKAQWKEPELTTLISEVGGGTNVRSKQAHVLCSINHNLRLGLTPRSRSRHWSQVLKFRNSHQPSTSIFCEMLAVHSFSSIVRITWALKKTLKQLKWNSTKIAQWNQVSRRHIVLKLTWLWSH